MPAAATAPASEMPRVDGYEVRKGCTCRWIYAPVVLLGRNRVVRELHWQPLADYLASKGRPP